METNRMGDAKDEDRTSADGRKPAAMVFAPSPLLTVTIEPGAEQPEIHFHAGGQGFWIARMLVVLGLQTRMSTPLSGEVGQILETLIASEGVDVRIGSGTAGNGAYVHDRREGDRTAIAETAPAVLTRHQVDDLYSDALTHGLATDVTVLGGPATAEVIPPDVYRRLAADLRSVGKTVVADLSGEALTAALAGGVTVIKVSHEDIIEDGRAENDDVATLDRAMKDMASEGAEHVVLSRGADPTRALIHGRTVEVSGPQMQLVDHRGAGDSMTAGIAAALAEGWDLEDALRLGMAAGTSNITRKGLASGQRQLVEQLMEHVTLQRLHD